MELEIKEKQLIQSYVFTAAKYDFSVFEKRILYRLIEHVQEHVNYDKNNGLTITKDLFDTRRIEIPIKFFYKEEKDNNYNCVKEAVNSLAQKRISYQINENGDTAWYNIGIINQTKIKNGICILDINNQIWSILFDFSRGYRKFEIKMAMSFKSAYTMRIYELINTKTESITYTVTQLKEMFKVEDKYKAFADFERSVILKAKDELDEKSPKSFSYKKNLKGKKTVSITFFPHELSEHKSKNTKDSEISPSWFLEAREINYLKENFDFSIDEIRAHNTLFKTYKANDGDLMKFLSQIKRKALDKENPKGYIISSLKNEINKEQPNNEDIIKVDSIVSDLTKNFTQK